MLGSGRCVETRVCVCVRASRVACSSGRLLFEGHAVAMWCCLSIGWMVDRLATWILPVYHFQGNRVDIAVFFLHRDTPRGGSCGELCLGGKFDIRVRADKIDRLGCRDPNTPALLLRSESDGGSVSLVGPPV